MVNDDVNITSEPDHHNRHLFFETARLFFVTDGGKFECNVYLSFKNLHPSLQAAFMHNVLIIVLFCISSCICRAQQNQIDSFLNELHNHPAEDTIRLMMLNNIAFAYYQSDPDKGLLFSEEEIVLAQKLQKPWVEGKAFFNKGINYWAKGMYEEALSNYKNAKALLEKAGTTKNVANLNNSMAVTYQSLSDYPKALEIYFDNLQLFEKMKDSYMMAITCGNIGIVYKNLSQYNKAVEYFNKAIVINKQADNKKELSDNYMSLGNVYEASGKSLQALAYYQKALGISRDINYTKGIAGNYANMGTAYISAGNYADAFSSLKSALPLYTAMKDNSNEAAVFKSMGDIFLSAPESFFTANEFSFQKKYPIAKEYYQKSLARLTAIDDVYGQGEVWEKLSTVYEKEGKQQEALEAYKKYILLRDSIFNDEKKEQVTRMEMRYNFQKKEDSLKAAHDKKTLIAAAEIKRQSTIKKFIAWGSFLLFTAALASFIFYKKRRDARQKQQEAEFKTEVADTEMKALRAQMNPHFIFNSLNSISDYITKNDTRSADRYLSKFAKLMRTILENSEQKDVSLADDLKALELYMQLEALRMNNKFSYEIKVDDAVDKETTLVPPLILQPFVENSIWHGIAKKEGTGKILIHIKMEGNDMIKCIVEDDGIGRQQSAHVKTTTAQKEKNSVGMKITQARIDILNKIKNTKAAVELFDLAQGLRVEVKLPLATNF
jgi:tetratricopeptide (TPR) repeat protein